MNRLKMLIIGIICLLVLTGCNGKYYATIDKNIVTEKVALYASNTNEYYNAKNWGGFPISKYIDEYLNPDETGNNYYDIKSNDSNRTLTTTNTFSLSNYNRSTVVRLFFEYFNIIKKGDITIFSTSKGLKEASYIMDITINTPYKVVTNNAHNVNKNTNTYTWHINHKNSSSQSIYFEIDFSKKFNETNSSTKEEQSSPETKNELKPGIYILIFIVIALITGVVYLVIKKKENDRM